MASRSKVLALVFAALIVSGCESDPAAAPSSPVVTDTLGNSFSVACSSAACVLTPKDPALLRARSCSVGTGGDAFVMLWSRVLTIHLLHSPPGGPAVYSWAEPSRPVACVSDADCSPWSATNGAVEYKYTCANAICQATSLSLSTSDVMVLCQADIPWPEACPYITTSLFASRLAEVGVACGTILTCANVPASCKQPYPPSGIDAGVTVIDSGGPSTVVDTGGALDAGLPI